jgi:predicted nucleotidyltransferase
MPEFFTTFARSRFVQMDKVREALQALAAKFLAQQPAVLGVYLVGSFATRTATPRSDIDLVLEVSPTFSASERAELWEQASEWFSQLPFAIDLFVLDSNQLTCQRGLAAVVQSEAITLAKKT